MTWKGAAKVHGSDHAKARKQWAARHDPADPCVRCGHQLGPMGPNLHLDHHDRDKTLYLGFSHAACNVKAGAARGRQQQKLRAAIRRGEITVRATTLRW